MRTIETSQLFWKTFPYKIVIHAPWAGTVRYTNHNALDIVDKTIGTKRPKFFNETVYTYPKELRRALNFIDQYTKEDLRFRCENGTLSLFFKDRNILNEIKKTFDPHIVEFHEPSSDEALTTLLDHKIIIKSNLIHGCRYKIMLKDNMSLLTDASKTNLSRLFKNNQHRYANVDRLVKDIDSNRKYIWQTYVYAKESKDLLMLQMIAQPIIREVIKIVTHAEIKEESTANEQ